MNESIREAGADALHHLFVAAAAYVELTDAESAYPGGSLLQDERLEIDAAKMRALAAAVRESQGLPPDVNAPTASAMALIMLLGAAEPVMALGHAAVDEEQAEVARLDAMLDPRGSAPATPPTPPGIAEPDEGSHS